MWKIVEGLVPNLSDPITCSFSDRRGRICVVCHSGAGRLGTFLTRWCVGLSCGVCVIVSVDKWTQHQSFLMVDQFIFINKI